MARQSSPESSAAATVCIIKKYPRNIQHLFLPIFYFLPQNKTGSKRADIKVAALLAHHSINRQMKPQRKYRLGTASNNNWVGGGALNLFYGAPTFTLIFRRSLHNLIGWEGGGGGFNLFYGAPTFTLTFRRSLHNLIGCLARMEVS